MTATDRPGWVRDPTDRHQLRWWDGSRWTDKIADDGVAAYDPAGPPPAARLSGTDGRSQRAPGNGTSNATRQSGDAGAHWKRVVSTVNMRAPRRGRAFVRAVGRGVDKAGRFDGRTARADYWWFQLFATSSALLLAPLLGHFAGEQAPSLLVLWVIFLSVALLSAGARRLHDTGRTGWWLLLHIVPPLGLIPLAVLLAKPGEPGPNFYGSPPEW